MADEVQKSDPLVQTFPEWVVGPLRQEEAHAMHASKILGGFAVPFAIMDQSVQNRTSEGVNAPQKIWGRAPDNSHCISRRSMQALPAFSELVGLAHALSLIG